MPANWPTPDADSLRAQLRRHSVALISLVIAVTSLGYNTWRNETTERQRNVRHAAFRVLEALGELQTVVDERYYYLPFSDDPMREAELRLRGYGSVAMIRDLMNLMPGDAPEAGQSMHALWHMHVNELPVLTASGEHTAAAARAERELSEAIDGSRRAVVEVLRALE